MEGTKVFCTQLFDPVLRLLEAEKTRRLLEVRGREGNPNMWMVRCRYPSGTKDPDSQQD